MAIKLNMRNYFDHHYLKKQTHKNFKKIENVLNTKTNDGNKYLQHRKKITHRWTAK